MKQNELDCRDTAPLRQRNKTKQYPPLTSIGFFGHFVKLYISKLSALRFSGSELIKTLLVSVSSYETHLCNRGLTSLEITILYPHYDMMLLPYRLVIVSDRDHFSAG